MKAVLRAVSLQVTRAALGNDCTLICGWSNQECARYLETFKRCGGGLCLGCAALTVDHIPLVHALLSCCQAGLRPAHGFVRLAHPRRLPKASSHTVLSPAPAPSKLQIPNSLGSYEHKPAEVIQKDLGTDYLSRINSTLTTVRGVNRTDVKTLGDRWVPLCAARLRCVLLGGSAPLLGCGNVAPT